MSLLLGKRKRRKDIGYEGNNPNLLPSGDHLEDRQILFRQHFEARFNPLESSSHPIIKGESTKSPTTDLSSESNWEGLSDGEKVQTYIVQTGGKNAPISNVPHEEFKSFMTARPPSTSDECSSSLKRKHPEKVDVDEAASDAANLKKDLALQRLLKESHLLDSYDSTSLLDQNRHKAIDLRLQDMGSKSSSYMQRNMPFAQRRGISLKAAERESRRRKNAQENGIILEKATNDKGRKDARRQRGLGAPSVGKFRGGTLQLSKRDVAEIQGPSKKRGGRS